MGKVTIFSFKGIGEWESRGGEESSEPLKNVRKMRVMKREISIRPEKPADIQSITDVTAAAFANHPVSQQTEQYIIFALREAGALALSLVAEIDGKLVGHIAFSPVSVSDGATGWYGMGPVSVLPDYQRRGVGSALVTEGLRLLREAEAQGCVLVGDSEYYNRFGFTNYPQLVYEGIPQEYFMALPFSAAVPVGNVVFHAGFSATE